jgi:ComF family protein
MWERLIQAFFPDRCVECGAWYTVWCEQCRRDVPPYTGVLPSLPVARMVVCATYTGRVREHILRLKYARQRRLAEALALLIAPAIPVGAVIVPIPTSQSRIVRRGYDDMHLCAHAVARQRGGVVSTQLVRTRDTHSQAGLNRQQRGINVLGAFAWQGSCRPGRYVLIDDICTTGATLCAAVAVMRACGIVDLDVVVVARGTLTPAMPG